MNNEDRATLEAIWNIYEKKDFLTDFKKQINDYMILIPQGPPWIRRMNESIKRYGILSKSAYIANRRKEEEEFLSYVKKYEKGLNTYALEYWEKIRDLYIDPCLKIMRNYISEDTYNMLNQFCGKNTDLVEFTRFSEDSFDGGINAQNTIPYFRAPGIIGRTIEILSNKGSERFRDVEMKVIKEIRRSCYEYYSNEFQDWNLRFERSVKELINL